MTNRGLLFQGVIQGTRFTCGKCRRIISFGASVYMRNRNGEAEYCHRICPSRRKSKVVIPKAHAPRFVHRGGKVDIEATLARGFSNTGSKVDVNGKEFLVGEDWEKRKQDVFTRDCGRCFFCGDLGNDPDHILKRSEGGDDSFENLRTLCRDHHNLRHPEHRTRFGERS